MSKEHGPGPEVESESQKPSHYQILGVSPAATPDDIKRARNRIAKEFHPDQNTENYEAANARMRDTNVAFDILSNPEKRAKYDSWLKSTGPLTDDGWSVYNPGKNAGNGPDTPAEAAKETYQQKTAAETPAQSETGNRESKLIYATVGPARTVEDPVTGYMFIVDPKTKAPISNAFDKIIFHDGVLIGQQGTFDGFHWLDHKTGQIIGGERGFDNITRERIKGRHIVVGYRRKELHGDKRIELGELQ